MAEYRDDVNSLDRARWEYHHGGVGNLLAEAPAVLHTAGGEVYRRLLTASLARLSGTEVLDREGLRERAERRGRVWYAPPEEPFEIRPASGDDVPHGLAYYFGTFEPDRSFVCELRDALFVGSQPVVLWDGGLVHEHITGTRRHLDGAVSDLVADRGYRAVARLLRRGGVDDATDGDAANGATAGGDAAGDDDTAGGATADHGATAGGDDGADGDAANGATADGDDAADHAGAPTRDAVFPMIYPRGHTYYNWMLDHLPKLRLLELYEDETGRRPQVMVGADPPWWMTDWLRVLGCDPDRVVPWGGGTEHVRRLVYPTHRARFTGNFNPSARDCEWLRTRVEQNVPDVDAPGDYPGRVYVSRASAQRRRPLNEERVLDVLSAHGFVSIDPATLDVEEQVRYFRNADVVVGPHGSNLTNVLFSEAASVVEILPDRYVKGEIAALCGVRGHDYEYLLAESVDGGAESGLPQTRDLVVDVGELESAVERAMAAT